MALFDVLINTATDFYNNGEKEAAKILLYNTLNDLLDTDRVQIWRLKLLLVEIEREQVEIPRKDIYQKYIELLALAVKISNLKDYILQTTLLSFGEWHHSYKEYGEAALLLSLAKETLSQKDAHISSEILQQITPLLDDSSKNLSYFTV